MQRRVGLDDLGLRDREDPATGLAPDDPGDGFVDEADPVGGQVAGELGDPPGDLELGLAGAAQVPHLRQPVDQVQHIGERVAGRGDPGASGQRDLTEAELLHPRCALTLSLIHI